VRVADVLLSDGSTVHLRPISPGDADRVVALHSRFSERTRYLRYFSPYPRIPARDLARFVNVDHADREALVAAAGDDLVAIGRYERLGAGATDAEVAFVVEDAFQGRGIGSVLLEHLAAAAREHGIVRFVAEVLPQNRTMLRVFSDAGFSVHREYADGVVHLTFPIAETVRSTEVQRRREQRAESRSIARVLAPRSIAVYGARRDGTGIGATLLRHVVQSGFTGAVHPIHPSASTLEGLPALRSAVDAPDGIDVAVVAVPAAEIMSVVRDAGRAGVHALVVASAGFAEEGAAGAVAQAEFVSAARADRMRVVGPNALGLANTGRTVRLHATVVPELPDPGRIGLFCQSAAVGIAVLVEAHERGIGLSTFISVGNRADVSGNDLLQFWRDDPRTDVVLLYLETFGNPRKFTRIARELSRDKPVVAVSAGGYGHVARAGHTGPAGTGGAVGLDEAASAALFAQSGVIRVDTVAQLFDVGELLALQPLPVGDRVGLVGNAAALVELARGAVERAGLLVPGPVRTVPTGAEPEELEAAVRAAVHDDAVDTVLVVIAPPLPGVDVVYESAAASAAQGADKPVLAVFVGSAWAAAGPLKEAGVPTFAMVEEAVRALTLVSRYATWRREPAGTLPILSDVDKSDVDKSDVDNFDVDNSDVDIEAARAVVDGHGDARALLATYGIEVLDTRTARSDKAALQAARALGYPVVVKTADVALRHRLDLGAVRLDLADARAVRAAYEEIAARFGPAVSVQPMAPPGVACVVEVVDDPAFGPVVGFGLGGLASELLGDRAFRAAPLTDVDAAALVRAPRAAALLAGYGGAPAVDVDALTGLLLRVGALVDEHPEIKHLSLNPVLAHADGLTVLHAEVAYGSAVPRPDTGPRQLAAGQDG
jgi:acyl-CoA synthetase (NDP forming)/GNAT superfamily N-acetyltransferase